MQSRALGWCGCGRRGRPLARCCCCELCALSVYFWTGGCGCECEAAKVVRKSFVPRVRERLVDSPAWWCVSPGLSRSLLPTVGSSGLGNLARPVGRMARVRALEFFASTGSPSLACRYGLAGARGEGVSWVVRSSGSVAVHRSAQAALRAYSATACGPLCGRAWATGDKAGRQDVPGYRSTSAWRRWRRTASHRSPGPPRRSRQPAPSPTHRPRTDDPSAARTHGEPHGMCRLLRGGRTRVVAQPWGGAVRISAEGG